jgi:hypothetical protein
MTTRRSRLAKLLPVMYSIPGVRSAACRIAPAVRWLRPDGRNLHEMLHLVRQAVQENWQHLEFMLHSSELMPDGSPTFRTEAAVEKLYEDLETLFSLIATEFSGATMGDFALKYKIKARQ